MKTIVAQKLLYACRRDNSCFLWRNIFLGGRGGGICKHRCAYARGFPGVTPPPPPPPHHDQLLRLMLLQNGNNRSDMAARMNSHCTQGPLSSSLRKDPVQLYGESRSIQTLVFEYTVVASQKDQRSGLQCL